MIRDISKSNKFDLDSNKPSAEGHFGDNQGNLDMDWVLDHVKKLLTHEHEHGFVNVRIILIFEIRMLIWGAKRSYMTFVLKRHRKVQEKKNRREEKKREISMANLVIVEYG